ncbi:Mg2+ transporter protein [Trypanosoma melophagium]|uniref:Mg2+ transporter protein n=1 Tax=Trypanosoma melophagium TaxID=715481 RepID=UPI003519F0C3|nr:Mg2+ transporter protein [Trypanosoma melophagium]
MPNKVDFAPVTGDAHSIPHCIIVKQSPGETVEVQKFDSPEEALSFTRKIFTAQEHSFIWVDLQGSGMEQNRRVLQLLFPEMQVSQMEAVLASDAEDVVELQPVRGQYLIGSLACARRRGRGLSAIPAASEEAERDAVSCSFACSERCLVTVHAVPFVGLAELLRHVEVEGGREQKRKMPVSRESCRAVEVLRGSAVLCALICFACETYLPDPTSLISEVDCIDEIVMLVAPGKRDQADLLRRVSVLRRRMAAVNRQLYMKEKLLQELMGPTMRTTFVSRDPRAVCAYRETQGKLSQVLERLETARDTLNHVNLNFVNAVSMRMSQTSARLDRMMTVLSQISTVCLPANLLASIFGMNCKVAWVAAEYDNLYAFWGIVGIILVWMVICLFAPVRDLFFSKEDED